MIESKENEVCAPTVAGFVWTALTVVTTVLVAPWALRFLNWYMVWSQYVSFR